MCGTPIIYIIWGRKKGGPQIQQMGDLQWGCLLIENALMTNLSTHGTKDTVLGLGIPLRSAGTLWAWEPQSSPFLYFCSLTLFQVLMRALQQSCIRPSWGLEILSHAWPHASGIQALSPAMCLMGLISLMIISGKLISRLPETAVGWAPTKHLIWRRITRRNQPTKLNSPCCLHSTLGTDLIHRFIDC